MLKKLSYILISFILLFLFCEISIRLLFNFVILDFDIEMLEYADKVKINDPVLGHKHRPNANEKLMGVELRTNSRGLRDYEYPYAKAPNSKRILALGDSLTLGWGVKFENLYSKLLEKKLNERKNNIRYEVINTGVGNYNTKQEYLVLKNEGIKYAPDMIILFWFINDAEIYKNMNVNKYLSWSKFLVFCWGRFDKILRMTGAGKTDYANYYKDLYSDNFQGYKEFKENMNNICLYANEKKIKLLIVLCPELHSLKNYPFTEVHKKVITIAENNNIKFIDLLSSVKNEEPRSLWVNYNDAHPNDKANIIYADSIYKFISENFDF